jgi:hypothetical protein
MGLRENDLRDLVYKVIEIDSYKSKMGSDAEIVTLCFTVNEHDPAKDLVDFIEKGYSFVLDADATSSEQSDGSFKVFVEMERTEDIPSQIVELIDGVSNLTGINDFRFRYYKGFQSIPLSLDSLSETIPLDTDTYDILVNESNMNNFKNFFNKSYLEEINLTAEEDLIIKKAYADPVGFKIKTFGTSTQVLESIKDKINMNDYAEILFLTKYIGDYNITKFGNRTLTLENKGHMLVVERI